ncbi:MAG: nitroreductase [Terricaulis sp.]
MPLPLSAIPPLPQDNDPANAAKPSAETLALLAHRRSTKIAHMMAPGPSDAELDALLHLAARVPDHGKLGPWRFVVIAGEARARAGEKLAHVIANDPGVDQTLLDAARGLFARAPVCVMVVASPVESVKVPEWEQLLSSAAACFALLISAHAFGYAGCWLTEWPTYDERARAALGLQGQERIAGFIYLGTSREPAIERFRADAASRISKF